MQQIAKNRVLWRESRNTEDATHKLLTDLQKDRAERIEGVNARVDERNRVLQHLLCLDRPTYVGCAGT